MSNGNGVKKRWISLYVENQVGVLSKISGLFSVFKHILELTALIADMVEYRVNDHPDVSFMGSFYQCGEILVGSEHGIHGKVILNVILVVADGLENRGQIQSVDSQIL